MNIDKNRYQNLALGILIGVLVLVSGAMVMPFLPAVLWAIVLSILMYPLFDRIQRRFVKRPVLGRTVASLVATLATLLLICVPLLLVGGLAAIQMGGVSKDVEASSLTKMVDDAEVAVKPLLARVGIKDFDLSNYVNEHRQDISDGLKGPIRTVATQIGFTAFTVVVALLSMFFFLRDAPSMKEPARQLSGLPAAKFDALLTRVKDTVEAVFVGTVLVAIIQGSIIGVTYYFLGVPNSVLLGLVSIVLCIVPLLGAPVIYIPVGLFFLAKGDVNSALWVFGVGFIVVSQIDNLLKPFLIGGRADLHAIAIFFFVLGGIALVGPIGLMVGPMVLVMLIGLSDYLRERLAVAAESQVEQGPAQPTDPDLLLT